MRRLLLLILCLLGFQARASHIIFYYTNWSSTVATNSAIRIFPGSVPMQDGNFIVTGPAKRYQLTNGVVTVSNMFQGTYQAVALGDPNPFVFEVPDDANTYYAATLHSKGLIAFITGGAWTNNLAPGTNVTFQTNAATVIINAPFQTNIALSLITNNFPAVNQYWFTNAAQAGAISNAPGNVTINGNLNVPVGSIAIGGLLTVNNLAQFNSQVQFAANLIQSAGDFASASFASGSNRAAAWGSSGHLESRTVGSNLFINSTLIAGLTDTNIVRNLASNVVSLVPTNIVASISSNVAYQVSTNFSTANLVYFTNQVVKTFTIQAFGALGDGHIATNSSMTAGSRVLTIVGGATSPAGFSSGFTAQDVGKPISVYGAGTAGKNLFSIITNVASPTSITLSNAAATSVSAKSSVFGTDQTVPINTAMDYAATNGGARIRFPEGIYCVAGALRDTGAATNHHNAQLFFAEVPKVGATCPTVIMCGPSQPWIRGLSNISSNEFAAFGATIWSLLDSASDAAHGRVLDCRNFNTPAAVGFCNNGDVSPMNNISVVIQDMSWRAGHDANLAILDLQGANGSVVERVLVNGGYGTHAPSLTGTNGWGIRTSGSFNENLSRADNVVVQDVYNGISLGENGTMPYGIAESCVNAMHLDSTAGSIARWVGNFVSAECSNVFAFGPCAMNLIVSHAFVHNQEQYMDRVNLIFDPSGASAGHVTYSTANTNGNAFALPIVGSSKMEVRKYTVNGQPDTLPMQYLTQLNVSNNIAGRFYYTFGTAFPSYNWGTNTVNFATDRRWSQYLDGANDALIINHVSAGQNNLIFDGNDNSTMGVSGKSLKFPPLSGSGVRWVQALADGTTVAVISTNADTFWSTNAAIGGISNNVAPVKINGNEVVTGDLIAGTATLTNTSGSLFGAMLGLVRSDAASDITIRMSQDGHADLIAMTPNDGTADAGRLTMRLIGPATDYFPFIAKTNAQISLRTNVTVAGLAGTGNRIVQADANGLLVAGLTTNLAFSGDPGLWATNAATGGMTNKTSVHIVQGDLEVKNNFILTNITANAVAFFNNNKFLNATSPFPNNATLYLDGTGAFSSPAGTTGTGIITNNGTGTNNVFTGPTITNGIILGSTDNGIYRIHPDGGNIEIGEGNIFTAAASAHGMTIAGGTTNTASTAAKNSFIAGGTFNQIGAVSNSFAGGYHAVVPQNFDGSFVWADSSSAADFYPSNINTVSFRAANGYRYMGGLAAFQASIFVTNDAWFATNQAHITQLGRYQNPTSSGTNFIAGDDSNTVGSSTHYAAIGGGNANSIGGLSTNSVIAGGRGNTMDGSDPSFSQYNVIGGGIGNTMKTVTNSGLRSANIIAGGTGNIIHSNVFTSAILGGISNHIGSTISISASTTNSVVLGGSNNFAKESFTLVWGTRATSTNKGAMVFTDSQASDFSSDFDNEFAIRAANGLRLVGPLTNNGSAKISGDATVNGFIVTTNGFASYRSNKTDSVSISVGASPFHWTNATAMNITAYVDTAACSVATVGLNSGTAVFSKPGCCTVNLQPGESFDVTYSGGSTFARWKAW